MRHLAARLLIPAIALTALLVLGEPLPPQPEAPLVQLVDEATTANKQTLVLLESDVRQARAVRIRMALTLPAVARRASS